MPSSKVLRLTTPWLIATIALIPPRQSPLGLGNRGRCGLTGMALASARRRKRVTTMYGLCGMSR